MWKCKQLTKAITCENKLNEKTTQQINISNINDVKNLSGDLFKSNELQVINILNADHSCKQTDLPLN